MGQMPPHWSEDRETSTAAHLGMSQITVRLSHLKPLGSADPRRQKKPGRHFPVGADNAYASQYIPGGQLMHCDTFSIPL
eukprot:195887-Hanusia_phi.AAC.2